MEEHMYYHEHCDEDDQDDSGPEIEDLYAGWCGYCDKESIYCNCNEEEDN